MFVHDSNTGGGTQHGKSSATAWSRRSLLDQNRKKMYEEVGRPAVSSFVRERTRSKPAQPYPARIFSRVTLRQNTAKLAEIGKKGVFK